MSWFENLVPVHGLVWLMCEFRVPSASRPKAHRLRVEGMWFGFCFRDCGFILYASSADQPRDMLSLLSSKGVPRKVDFEDRLMLAPIHEKKLP